MVSNCVLRLRWCVYCLFVTVMRYNILYKTMYLPICDCNEVQYSACIRPVFTCLCVTVMRHNSLNVLGHDFTCLFVTVKRHNSLNVLGHGFTCLFVTVKRHNSLYVLGHDFTCLFVTNEVQFSVCSRPV